MSLAAVVGQFPTILAALILATDRRIARRLRTAGAVNAAHVVEFHAPGPVGPARLRRMVAVGAVREAGANRYYLDENNFRAWRVVRRKRALAVLAIMVALIAILVFAGVVRVR
jgi:hypothetical protein